LHQPIGLRELQRRSITAFTTLKKVLLAEITDMVNRLGLSLPGLTTVTCVMA
jgi:hypothetical protein